MDNPITATEVRMRLAEWEFVNQPRYAAKVDALVGGYFRGAFRAVDRWLREQDLQQQRMTDDGCPLGT